MDRQGVEGKEAPVTSEEANMASVDSIKRGADISGVQYSSVRGVASFLSYGENRRDFETALNLSMIARERDGQMLERVEV